MTKTLFYDLTESVVTYPNHPRVQIIPDVIQMFNQFGHFISAQFPISVCRISKERSGLLKSDDSIIVGVMNLFHMRRIFFISGKEGAVTLASHQELENALISPMRAMRNVDDYISLLQLFYSYFGALEDRISLYIGSAELPDHLQRRKSVSLVNDIISLGGACRKKPC